MPLDCQIEQGNNHPFAFARGTMRGAHTGTFMNIPPTGKEFMIDWIDIYRVEDGKQVEVWHLEDLLKLLQQLGVIPMPQQPSS